MAMYRKRFPQPTGQKEDGSECLPQFHKYKENGKAGSRKIQEKESRYGKVEVFL